MGLGTGDWPAGRSAIEQAGVSKAVHRPGCLETTEKVTMTRLIRKSVKGVK